ncbi:MAG: TetR/AcrR family transcriptional regulator [Sulfuritalea sp.]|nr:TetR/AcrR family transcriptional regulator [Sulfuritalea sp.]MDP1982639.1 TetR/AcrR family transcriptional regulator [Sulfuritalea sp.]
MPVSRTVPKAAAPAPGTPAETQACIDKRERVLAVAEDLFYRNGFAGTTMDMICAELGVTKPFVYYYFHDKHEIVETLAWRASVACLTTMKFPAADTRPAHLKLAEGLQRWVAACVEHFRSSALAFRVTAALRPEFRAALRDLANDFYADLGALMEEGRRQGKLSFEDTTVTTMAMGGAVGFMYTWYRPEGRLPPDALVAQLSATLGKMVGLRLKPPRTTGAQQAIHPRRTSS